jgi:hypothetical protein
MSATTAIIRFTNRPAMATKKASPSRLVAAGAQLAAQLLCPVRFGRERFVEHGPTLMANLLPPWPPVAPRAPRAGV